MAPHLWDLNSVAGPFLRIFCEFSFERKYKDKAFLEQESALNQRSVRNIAESLGCSHSTILSNLQRLGIPIRDTKPDHGELAARDSDENSETG